MHMIYSRLEYHFFPNFPVGLGEPATLDHPRSPQKEILAAPQDLTSRVSELNPRDVAIIEKCSWDGEQNIGTMEFPLP